MQGCVYSVCYTDFEDDVNRTCPGKFAATMFRCGKWELLKNFVPWYRHG